MLPMQTCDTRPTFQSNNSEIVAVTFSDISARILTMHGTGGVIIQFAKLYNQSSKLRFSVQYFRNECKRDIH